MRATWIKLGFELQLAWKGGLFLASLLVAALMTLTLECLFSPEMKRILLPLLFLCGTGCSSLFFLLGLFFYERTQGILRAVAVSPMRSASYLCLKVLALITLAFVEALPVALVTSHAHLHLGVLLVALALGSALFTCAGLLLAIHYRSLTDCLIPAVVIATLLQLPALPYLGLCSGLYACALPTWPIMLLLKYSLHTTEAQHVLWAMMGAVLWLCALFWLATRMLRRQELVDL